MQYLILPSTVTLPATHTSPTGDLVHVRTFADNAKIHSPHSVVATLTGYTPLSAASISQSSAQAIIDAQYAAIIAKGVTLTDPSKPGTITLAADDAARSNFTQLLTHLANAESVSSTVSETITVEDLSGRLHVMTVKQFQKLMADYGRTCYALWTAYRQKAAAATAAH